jgi:hypothetical protein
MKFLKKLFKKNKYETVIFSRGKRYILKNGKYMDGSLVDL